MELEVVEVVKRQRKGFTADVAHIDSNFIILSFREEVATANFRVTLNWQR